MRPAAPLELRSGTRDSTEALRYAELENRASGGGSARLYGRRWRELLAHLYRRSDTLQSHRRTRVAWAADGIVGHLTYIGFAEYARCARATAREATHFLGWRALRPACLGRLRSLTGLRLGPTRAGDFHVGSLAIAPDWRRRGVASALLAEVERIAREVGASRLSLDVAPDNAAARALYQRHGFHDAARSPRRFRRIVRLRKDLSPPTTPGGSP